MHIPGKRIAIKVDPIENKSPGGIELPESQAKIPNTGSVVAVGIECSYGVGVGDRVIFNPSHNAKGNKYKIEGEELLFLDEAYIVAVIATCAARATQ